MIYRARKPDRQPGATLAHLKRQNLKNPCTSTLVWVSLRPWLANVPTLPRRKNSRNDVGRKPVRVLGAAPVGYRHREAVAAEDVCDAVQPDLVGELVTIALTERDYPRARLEDLFRTQNLIWANLVPQDRTVRPPVEAADGRDDPLWQSLTTDLQRVLVTEQRQAFARFPNLGSAEKAEALESVLLPVVLVGELLHEAINLGMGSECHQRLREHRLHPLDLLALALHVLFLRCGLHDLYRLKRSPSSRPQKVQYCPTGTALALLPEAEHPFGLDREILQTNHTISVNETKTVPIQLQRTITDSCTFQNRQRARGVTAETPVAGCTTKHY